MKSVDKNDVKIESLFNWGSEFTLPLPGGDALTCYIRVIGDADLNKARAKALRKSAELRKKLKDPESEERQAFIPELDLDDKERYVDIIVSLESPEIIRRVRRNISLPYPKDPASDASIEELEKHQEEVDSWPERFNELLRDSVTEKVTERKDELMKESFDKILKAYEGVIIDNTCESEMMTKFSEYCVYYGTFADPEYKQRLFESFEQFENLPRQIKEQFTTFYGTLNIDIEELKK